MKYKFCDLVDLGKINSLMQSLYLATGIPSSIVDVDGDILVACGWQKICMDFHRQNLQTKKLCRQSDDSVKQHLTSTKPYLCYKCANGLVDAAAPIIIDGEHVATVFHGQFLFEKPNLHYFEQQAERYGFDKEAYQEALTKVPIYSHNKFDDNMNFLIEFTRMLAELGMARLRQIEQQEQKLQRSDEQIFTIFNSTPNVAIQGFDVCGNITFWNNASEQLYGFRQDEVIGRAAKNVLFDDEGADLLGSILKEINLTNSLYGPTEWKVKHKSGDEKQVYATLFPIRLSSDKKEFICMDVDITEQKRLEEEIKRLDRLNLIGEMAASLAHELRNPMTTVRGYLQMLRNKKCYYDYVNQLDLMIEELDCANQIISEYLSLAKNKSIEKERFNLNQKISKLLPLLSAEAMRENKIITWIPGNIQTLLMDHNEIRQLVINIVRNALEAVEQGGAIQISTFMENGAIVLMVQDNGKGIPKELLDKLGTPFVTTKTKGTGLGLAVCFSIADRHNARISIQSNNLGTSVFVKFFTNQ